MKRYKMITVGGKQVLEHRYLWEQAYGPIPPGYEVHHKNGDGFDNNLSNLILLTKSEHRTLHANARVNGTDVVDSNDPLVKKIREYHREYYASNCERIKAAARAYRAANRERITAHDRERRHAHKEERAITGAAYYAAHREEKRAFQRRYNATHKEQRAQYRKDNVEKILEYSRATQPIRSAQHALAKSIRRGDPQSVIDERTLRVNVAKVAYKTGIGDVSDKTLALEAATFFDKLAAKK